MRPVLLLALASGLCPGAELRYNRDVRPILSDNCFACHGPDASKAEAGLQLHERALATAPLGRDRDRHAVVPGKRRQSELWKRITATDPEDRMPPGDSHLVLTRQEIDLLGQWIDEGAEYEGHWAFEPVEENAGGSIDAYVRNRLRKEGLDLSPQADRATLLRRLTQDLTGFSPMASEVLSFLGDDDAGAYERAVDRLLESPAHAERLALDWLDGARYADTNGYSIDDHREMWIWRDWVIHAFLHNKPFDEFTVEQLAGDLLPRATEQQRVATGFLRNSMNTHEGGTIAEEYRVTYTADKVDTVSTVFMGLTMKCAQCHDHKYDPITQKEYYQLFAFFNASSEPGGGAVNANTRPLMEAGSLICDPQRVKRDVGYRLAELQQMRRTPEPAMADLRDAWERKLLPTLQPVENGGVGGALPVLPEKPAAKWIWASEDKQAERVDFRREFEAGSEIKSAQIWVTCDDGCTVSLNGKAVGEKSGHWNAPRTFPVSLRSGKNVLEVVGKNTGASPAGLLMSLAFRVNGEVRHVLTDEKWQARLPGKQWKTAAAVGRHGDAPWGRVDGGKAPAGGVLHAALAKPKVTRSDADWKTINDAFAAEENRFKIYINQLNLEEKVIGKSAETGRGSVMVMDYKPRKTHILIRGAYDQHGDEVKAGGPRILPPLVGENGKERSRLDLARWLVDPAHPLTARVIVNRYWQMIFGTGIVKTVEDFGAQGEFPSHPDLLDWLAHDFVKHGWNVRRLLKQIVMSETYQQTSAATPGLLERDPYNRLLARAPRYRLAAEFVRDSALSASGLLNRDLGGPSVHPYQPDGLWAEVSHYGYPAGFTSQKYLPGSGRANYRRSMYTAWKRTSPPPTMTIFDAPNRETCTVRRLSTNTPLQALVLQNDPQFLEAARALGAVMAEQGSPGEGVEEGVLRVLGRYPTATEAKVLAAAQARYRKAFQGRRGDAEDLLSAGEWQAGSSEKIVELASWTLVASTLLNMDEAMTRQ